MQNILAVNVSKEPAEALIVEIEGKRLSVKERHTATLNNLFLSTQSSPSNLTTAEQSVEIDRSVPDQAKLPEENSFIELISGFTSEWSNSILIVPGQEYLSLNIELPFSDDKAINKVIDLEIQDIVPFDISEFLLDHCLINGGSTAPLNEVHVGIIPKQYIQKVLSICRSSGFEPMAITCPSSALAAFYHLAPEFFPDNSSMLYMSDSACYSCSIFDGKVCSDRAFLSHWINQNGNELDKEAAYLKEFKVALASLEKKYKHNTDKIYVLDSDLSKHNVQSQLARNVDILDSSDLIKGATQDSALTAAAAIFVKDETPPRLFTNFRTREFNYRPQLRQLYAGLNRLAPYFGLAVALAILLIFADILLIKYNISKIDSTVLEEVSRLTPELANQEDLSAKSIKAAADALEHELDSLGAPSRHTPIDVFQHIAKDTSKTPDLDIQQIRITSSRIILKGRASSYAAAEDLRRVLRRNKDMYCKIDRDNASSVGNSRGFTYTIELCS